MACLNHPKAHHDSEDDPNHLMYKKIQDANANACDLGTARGFGGNNLKVEPKKNLLTPGTVTVPNSKERVEAQAKVKSHGARFLITGGGHMCTDDTFNKALELKDHREKRVTLKKDMALCIAVEKVEKDALPILETKVGNNYKKFTGLQLRTLLALYGVEKKKQGKSIAEMRAKYNKLKCCTKEVKEVDWC